MGKWAKSLFGRESFSDVGVIVAGNNPDVLENRTLRVFDAVNSNRDCAYHAHLAKINQEFYPVVFNVYGAPAVIDVLAQMHDGGCRNVIFVGYAYGFKDLKVGDVVVPTNSYHFDSVYRDVDSERLFSSPNTSLKFGLWSFFNSFSIDYSVGTNVSVPAVTLQLPHDNEHYRKIKPLTIEMELASFFSRAKDIGIRAAGVLIVSDTRNTNIIDKEARRERKTAILELLFRNIGTFTFPPLDRKFSIDEYLAGIVGGSDNVYKQQ
ncbi:hypothetical protein HYT57_01190 [Candidatus Woesearchaeota archaeon]|nr:hypothetical protein [Candidatus Woesearchaeota archaeon]